MPTSIPLALGMAAIVALALAPHLQAARPELPPTWREYLERLRRWRSRSRPYDWSEEGI